MLGPEHPGCDDLSTPGTLETQRVSARPRRLALAAVVVGLLTSVPALAKDLLHPQGRQGQLVADGAWCWFQDPRAVHHVGLHDRTYIGFVTSKGDVEIASQDARTSELAVSVIHARLQRDDHASPGVVVQPDGHIGVFYSKHTGKDLLYRVSTHPEDVTSFGPERVVAHTGSSAGLTYGNPIYLPAENRTYVFFRGGTSRPTVTWSDDGMRTWAPARTMVEPNGKYRSARPYVKYATNGWDTVLMSFTDGHPRDEPHDSVYAMTLRGGVFRTVAGVALATLQGTEMKGVPRLPVRLTSLPRLYNGAGAAGKAWVWSTAFDGAGKPVVAFATFPNDRDHRYWYARWTGTAWASRQFARAGGSIAASGDEPDYSGGMDLDPSDPSTLYASREIAGQWELERWHTPDGGATWDRPASLTSHSRVRQIRPVVPWGPAGEVKVLWMAGRYDSWDSGYSTALQELTSGPSPTTVTAVGPRTVRRTVPFAVTGRLVRGKGGRPLANAVVKLYLGAVPLATGATDEHGDFYLTASGLVSGDYTVRFPGDADWGQATSAPMPITVA